MNTKDELMPLADMARWLRVPKDWLKTEAESGRLPCLKAGRVLMFHVETIEKLLAERAANGVSDER